MPQEKASPSSLGSSKARVAWQGCSVCSDRSDGSARGSYRSSASGSGSLVSESRKSSTTRGRAKAAANSKEADVSNLPKDPVKVKLQELAAKRLGMSEPLLLKEILNAHPAV